MIYGFVSLRALGHQTLRIKLELVSSHYVVSQLLRFTGAMNSMPCSFTFNAEGAEGYPPSAKSVSGLHPDSTVQSQKGLCPISDRAAPWTS